ncbi:MAG: hypothetical protein WCF94_04170 [bacterium]
MPFNNPKHGFEQPEFPGFEKILQGEEIDTANKPGSEKHVIKPESARVGINEEKKEEVKKADPIQPAHVGVERDSSDDEEPWWRK